MAGVGEAAAIIGLVSTAAELSKAVIGIGAQYKNARVQIESFGREVSMLGKILDQLSRLLSKGASHIDIGVHLLTTEIVDECSSMFAQLDAYKNKLYGNSAALNPTLRGKTKWVFEAAELDYLRTRVDSMKINLLLMMTFQAISAPSGNPAIDPRIEQQTRSLQMLSAQSDACVQRLESLEEHMAISPEYGDDELSPAVSIKSFETSNTVRTTRDSILSLYERTPYAKKLWSTSESSFTTAQEAQDSDTKVSGIVEDYLGQLSRLPSGKGLEPDPVVETPGIDGDSGPFESNVKCVLSLDGGGIRTYSSILILQSLMVEVANVESNIANNAMKFPPQPLAAPESRVSPASTPAVTLTFHPCQYFDYIGGNSTGGIVAIMLGRLRMSAPDCLSEYRRIAESMFGSPRFASTRSPLFWLQPKYDHHAFESQFESLLRRFDMTYIDEKSREVLLVSDIKHCKTVVVTWLRDSPSGSGKPCLFRSYEPRFNDSNVSWLTPTQTPLWKISRALISSPKYFSPIKIRGHEFMGGKKGLHNPSLVVSEEVMKMEDTTNDVDICFVSIGSGISGCFSVGGVAASSNTDASVPEDMAQKSARSKRYAYYRLNPGHMLGDIKFDDWQKVKGSGEEVTIDRITRATKEYLSDDTVRRTLRAIAESLVRKRRACSEKANLKRFFSSRLLLEKNNENHATVNQAEAVDLSGQQLSKHENLSTSDSK